MFQISNLKWDEQPSTCIKMKNHPTIWVWYLYIIDGPDGWLKTMLSLILSWKILGIIDHSNHSPRNGNPFKQIGDHLSLIIDHILPSILWGKNVVFCRKLHNANPGYWKGLQPMNRRRLRGFNGCHVGLGYYRQWYVKKHQQKAWRMMNTLW